MWKGRGNYGGFSEEAMRKVQIYCLEKERAPLDTQEGSGIAIWKKGRIYV